MPATVMSRFSYPKVPGDGLWSVADITGPSSYSQINPGTPVTGGQKVTAADFGLQSLDWVGSMADNLGNYMVTAVPQSFAPGAPFSSMVLIWKNAYNSNQVSNGANLSTTTVRLMAIGR